MAKDGLPSISDILAGFARGQSRTYEIDVPNGILKSNDAADHARAMEALDRLERLRGLQPAPVASKVVVPKSITLEKAIANYVDIEAPGLKADTWDDSPRHLPRATPAHADSIRNEISLCRWSPWRRWQSGLGM